MIRLMEIADLDDVVKMESDLFTLPWGKEDFYRELTQNEFAHYYVIEENDQIVGYCGFWTLYEQSQITTIGVSKDYQGKGYSKGLLEKIIEISIECGCETCSLEVRISNHVAQELYKKYEFITVNTRKSYYADNNEDAYLMIKAIGGLND